ncbi:conserved membrane hypothetical protein [Paraburkholderia sabiae]|uniref:hypothetical protein n=1 Tax=Paraburkholderia sabiae TaxID=273251 RepID=UPI001CAD10C4|nr:hypothetical protein [Paraburkholderia sabiae]CAG9213081.1 conserved membrane hypothetical protein [Paraburkholderia sabiae]
MKPTSTAVLRTYWRYRLGFVVGAISLFIAGLFLIPFSPVMPESGLDPSWRYALNEALERGYVFGKDLIFTFGPLGSVFSTVFDPATDRIMMIGSAVYAIGLCAALGLIAHPRRHVIALFLPVIVSVSLSRDSGFIALPFCLLLAITRVTLTNVAFRLQPTPAVILGIAVATVASAMTPIVKGSFVGTTVSVCGLAFIMLFMRNVRAAFAFAALVCLTLIFAWCATGQAITQLPHFFLAQGPIISGYTDAMSLSGPGWAPLIFVLASLVSVIAFYLGFARANGRWGWIAILGFALTLFIAFKAGFVRQDGHVFVATGTLLFVTYAMCLVIPLRSATLAGATAIAAWILIGQSIFPITGSFVTERVRSTWQGTVSGITNRLTNPASLNVSFEEANKQIRAEVPLPHVAGSVDVYPTELSAIFANGLNWAGRPVFQSYSVYDPVLDAENVAHLHSAKAPDTIFFTFAPIDHRLPTFDDSGSLLTLLTEYKVVAYNPPYVQLEKATPPAGAVLDTMQTKIVQGSLGDIISLDSSAMTWLTLDVRPTLIGKLAKTAFKLPELQIELTLDNGQVVQHRFIPAIGKTGFIVSPYMTGPQDFILIAAGLSGTPRVKTFKITAHHNGFWNPAFTAQLTPINVSPQPIAKRLVLTAPSTPPAEVLASTQSPQPRCNIDFMNGVAFSSGATVAEGRDTLKMDGWIAPVEKISSDSMTTWVVLTAADGSKTYFRATPTPRPDVAQVLNRPDLQKSGFTAMLDITSVHGQQTIDVIAQLNGVAHSCGLGIKTH